MNQDLRSPPERSIPPDELFAMTPWAPLLEETLDKEIAPLIAEINQSGRLWSAESCAGHEETAEHPSPFGGPNGPFPYLRLLVDSRHAWTVFRQAALSGREIVHARLQPILRPHPDCLTAEGWTSFYIAFPQNSAVELTVARLRLREFVEHLLEYLP